MLNDVFILTQIKEGNIKAFETLFRQYYTPLRLYAASITGEPDVAEEIVEELFYVFWKDRENLRFFILSRTISIGLYVTALSNIANIRMSEGAIRMRFYPFR